jgi:nanoRNase/pAp phosphatase (c-di-AMP/oligoRNAs hydrolase)
MTNSQTFDSVWDPEKYDAMLTFGWRRGQWTVSLYSVKQDVDVSEVAVKHGGGGHKGAAGFQCTELPFRLDCRSGEGGA